MKKISSLVAVLALTVYLSSCATPMSPVVGLIYQDVKAPMTATSNVGSAKVGKAEAKSILGLVAQGDASIEAAAKAGNIKKIHHIDYESKSILGIIGTFTTIVYGE